MKLEFPKRYLSRFILRYGRNLSISEYLRAGVFLFFWRDNVKHFIFSVSSIDGVLSDFAGKRDVNDRCWRETAARELYEESSGLFDLSASVVANASEVVTDGKCVYAFVEITDPGNLDEIFHFNPENFETVGIKTICETDLMREFLGNGMWNYLRMFFSYGKQWPRLKRRGEECQLNGVIAERGVSLISEEEFAF